MGFGDLFSTAFPGVGDALQGNDVGSGLRNTLGDVTGANAANRAVQSGFGRAADANLQGMREGIAAQDRWGAQARSDLAPFRESDMAARNRVRGIADNMDPNSAYYQQRWGAMSRDINAQTGKAGTYGGGGWARAIAKARIGMEQDFQQQRLGAYQSLYSGAGGQQAQLAAQQGQSEAGMLQHGYGQQAGIFGEAGQAAGQAAMGPFGTLLGAAGAAGALGYKPFGKG